MVNNEWTGFRDVQENNPKHLPERDRNYSNTVGNLTVSKY